MITERGIRRDYTPNPPTRRKDIVRHSEKSEITVRIISQTRFNSLPRNQEKTGSNAGFLLVMWI